MLERNAKIALTPVAGAVLTALYPAVDAIAQDVNELVLEEIIVTATKRTLSIQDIPATVQAITQESLAQMGAKSMEDFARFMPGINVVSGVTGSTVVFRGAITGGGYIAASTSSVYLDELPLTTTGSQPNVRMVDIARVEALSGPQGTLYGSSAQAGTMRIITNKPVMNEFEAVLDGEIRSGSESDMSYRGSIVFNAPILEDKLALRVSLYSDRDGGFIDNVYGHTADSSAISGDMYTQDFGTLDNAASVDDNHNDADISGIRAALRWEMNDNWSATLSTMAQHTQMGAGNGYNPYKGDLQTVSFHDDWYNEKWTASSLQIEGDLGFAQLVSSTSFYKRGGRGVWDITNYAHYWAAAYCADSYYTQADYPYYYANPETGYITFYPRYCEGEGLTDDYYSSYQGKSRDDKHTHEMRLSSQGDNFDWLVGLYLESARDHWWAPFAMPTTGGKQEYNTSTFQDSYAAAAWAFEHGNATPGAVASWYSEASTDWEQTAVFGELVWHVNDDVDITVGARNFERTNHQRYIVDHPGGMNICGEPDTGSQFHDARVLFQGDGTNPNLCNIHSAVPRSGTDKELIPKLSIKYNLDEDSMVYALYTQGKRPGGVNRSRGAPYYPNSYGPDIMDNYEGGIKSSFSEGRGRFNLIVYNMEWDKYQLEQVDPSSTPCDANGAAANVSGLEAKAGVKTDHVCGQPWQNLVANTGEAHITGANLEVDYRFTERLSGGLNFETMEAQSDDAVGIPDGQPLPLVPKNKGAFWLDYNWPTQLFGSDNGFARFQYSTQDGIWNSITGGNLNAAANPRLRVPGYSIADARIGFQGEDWEVSMFLNNLTDERAQYSISNGDFGNAQAQSVDGVERHQYVYVNRPREMGIRYTKSWN
tara:strand:- start:54 stop:2681 length:2628 start_codon:yes stop_codon:yes gene_type:complete